jgi:hypothetical protein
MLSLNLYLGLGVRCIQGTKYCSCHELRVGHAVISSHGTLLYIGLVMVGKVVYVESALHVCYQLADSNTNDVVHFDTPLL